MRRIYLLFVIASLLLAGCVSLPLAQAQNNTQQPAQNGAQNGSVAEITTVLEKLASLQGQPVDLTFSSAKNVELVELTYLANGNEVKFYATPDYKSIIIPLSGKPTSLEEIKAVIAQAEGAQAQEAQQFPSIDTEGANFKGNTSSSIKIVEFSDFQCPFCGRFFQQTYPQLNENYIAPGKVAFYYMHFPLDSIHPAARPAALAAECAAEQGFFWEMHDAIFKNQNDLSNDRLKALAAEIEGINASEFNTCFDEGRYSQKVEDELQRGVTYGVRGTPAFFIIVEGGASEAALKQLEGSISKYGGSVALGNDSEGNTVVFVSGALPYSAFEEILSAVVEG